MSILQPKPCGDAILLMPKEFDAAAAGELRATFDRVASNATSDVILDFIDVEFIDSCSVGAVVYLYKRLAPAGCALW